MTKENLLQQYMSTFDYSAADQVRTALFAQINANMPLPPEYEKKLRLLFDKNVEEGKNLVMNFMRKEFNEEELRYLIEHAKHPATKKIQKFFPLMMDGFFDKVQASVAMFEEVLADPKKIESLPS